MAKKKMSDKSVVMPPQFPETAPKMPSANRPIIFRYVTIGLALLLRVLFAANKGWIVSAVVNGKPIFSWQLNSQLRSRFGQQTLEGMIGEILIADEARKAGVSVTQSDLDAKQKQILASVGPNVQLDDLLKFQGLTKEDFLNQLKLQLTVERLLTKDMTISDADVNNYIATNRATLVATDPAQLREEAKQAIISNSVNEKLQTWFSQIRQKAAVMKFL
jgi:hypothetical protein